jgi:hypothetical protein
LVAAVDAHKGTMQQRNISLSHVRKAVTKTVADTDSEGRAAGQHEEVDIKHWLVLNATVIDDEVPAEMIEHAILCGEKCLEKHVRKSLTTHFEFDAPIVHTVC